MIVACVALIVALGGTGIAATTLIDGTQIRRNTIPGDRIRSGTLGGAKLRNGGVTAVKVKPNTLGGRQINEGLLGTVPSAANAGSLGGIPAGGYPTLVAKAIPSGTTVTGAFGIESVVGAGGANAQVRQVVSLPGLASADLTDANVNFASAAAATDGDAACTGTSTTPTAPAGKVCIYISAVQGTSTVEGQAIPGLGGSRQGFVVHAVGVGDTAGAFGTWAYHAP